MGFSRGVLALLTVALGLGFVSSLRSAELIRFRSSATATPFLELYSSEGCSSCPPAETWLSRLKNDPKLWQDFVPVAFHVDYWDYLGWKDPFASKAFSERQHGYAAQWRSESVYTPGFVLNGKEWRGWSYREAPANTSPKTVGVLTAVSEDGRQWKIEFQPAVANGAAQYDFHAALLGFDLATDVKRGENRGRKLEHDFVVLTMADGAAAKSGDSFQATVVLNRPANFSPKRLAVAAWVTPGKSQSPVQSAGGWLSAPPIKP